MSLDMKIHFLGASGTVTGSKFLLEMPEINIMVDCGLFQGLKELRTLNWEPFPFPPDKIDVILLTHGHLDHSGYLPRLVAQGFKGKIMGTAPSLAIASIIVLDSAKIQEEQAQKANEEGFSIHTPALPLYSLEDAEKAIGLFRSVEPGKWSAITPDIKFKLEKNGHIIGATHIELDILGKIFLFSGDIGREQDLLLDPPKPPEWGDYIFLESTYGDRLHPEDNSDEILKDAILDTIKNNSILIIPSFAVERLQTLMYKLWQLYNKNSIPKIPIFIDSPMGNEVFGVFERFPSWHKINPHDLAAMKNHFNIITSYKDTWKTIDDKRAKVVIAGSGMVSGGRVLTYLRYFVDKPETTVLLVGFQAEGTRGRQLLDGDHEIKIFGKYCEVNAKIKTIESLSAHADQKGIIDWLGKIKNIPEKVFLIHGEPTALDVLRVKIKDTYQWQVHIPHLDETVSIKL
ncbi:MAG: MBL fold metallo-hydrolase [Gillisia sp.]